MPSTDIVRGIRTQIQNKLLPSANYYWRSQLTFGLQAYGLRSFQSATGSVRLVVASPDTAARKSERLFGNRGLADQLGTVFDSLQLIRPSSYVNVDHSDVTVLRF
jgi:hypothetical protein